MKWFLVRVSGDVWPGVTPGGRTPGRSSGRTIVGGARIVSGTKKKAFDRGGPVWPPRSNAADDRLGGGGALPPLPKNRVVWEAEPLQPKPTDFEEYDYL